MEHQSIVLYILLATMAAFLFTKIKNPGSPQILLLFILLVIISLSTVLNGWIGGVLYFVPKFGAAAIIPFIFFSKLVTTPKKHKILMLISIFAALLMVHNGVDQKLSELGIGWAGSKLSEGTRITYLGTLNDPNDLGMFFIMVLPMIAYFIARANLPLKCIWIMVMLIMLYGIFLTNSRGALLGILSLGGLFVMQKYGIKKTAILLTFILPIIFIVISKFRTISSNEESAAGRLDAWYSGLQMFKQSPLFGIGMNNFTEYNNITAHNSYVLVISELGLCGFIIWMLFFLLTLFMLYSVAFYKEPLISNLSTAENKERISISEKQDEIMLAKASFYSLMGFAITAFFLSRSYTFLLYIYAGIGVANYYRTFPLLPLSNPVILKKCIFKLISISLAFIVFLFIAVKILI